MCITTQPFQIKSLLSLFTRITFVFFAKIFLLALSVLTSLPLKCFSDGFGENFGTNLCLNVYLFGSDLEFKSTRQWLSSSCNNATKMAAEAHVFVVQQILMGKINLSLAESRTNSQNCQVAFKEGEIILHFVKSNNALSICTFRLLSCKLLIFNIWYVFYWTGRDPIRWLKCHARVCENLTK